MPILKENSRLLNLLNSGDGSLGYEAYYTTRYNRPWSDRDFLKSASYNASAEHKKDMATYYKSYPHATKILLEKESTDTTSEVSAKTFLEVLKQRRSVRNYSGESIDLKMLSQLIGHAFGSGGIYERSPAPSGGARRPIEIYLAILNIDSVAQGFYHLNRNDFCLELINESSEIQAQLDAAGWSGDAIEFKRSTVVFFFTGVVRRTVEKYGDRGWRFVYLDAGHYGENLWLTATSLGLSCAAFGGGYESKLSQLLGLSQAIEVPIISYVIGASTV